MLHRQLENTAKAGVPWLSSIMPKRHGCSRNAAFHQGQIAASLVDSFAAQFIDACFILEKETTPTGYRFND